MSIAERRAAFGALLSGYHNSFENVKEGAVRHSRQFIRNVLMLEAGKQALSLDPRLTSTDSGAVAVGIAKQVMTNEKAARSFIDIEIGESGAYIVSFDKDVQPDMAVTLINSTGTSAVLCKAGDHIGEGLISDLLILAVEPTATIAESYIAAEKGRVDENHPAVHAQAAWDKYTKEAEAHVPDTDLGKHNQAMLRKQLHPAHAHMVMQRMKPSKSPIKSTYIIGGNIGIRHEDGTEQTVSHRMESAMPAAHEAHVGTIDKGVWAKAEAAARKSYGAETQDKNPDKFYSVTMSIYKKMHGVKESSEEKHDVHHIKVDGLEKADVEHLHTLAAEHGGKAHPAEKNEHGEMVSKVHVPMSKTHEFSNAWNARVTTSHAVRATGAHSLGHYAIPVKESAMTLPTITEAQAAAIHKVVFGEQKLVEGVTVEAKSVPHVKVMFSHPIEGGDINPMLKKIGDHKAFGSHHDFDHARKAWIHHFSFKGKDASAQAHDFGKHISNTLKVPHHVIMSGEIKESANKLDAVMRAFAVPGLREKKTCKFDDIFSAAVGVVRGWPQTSYGVCAESAAKFDELVENVVLALAEHVGDTEVSRRATFEIAHTLVEDVSEEELAKPEVFADKMPAIVRARLIECGIGHPDVSAALAEICA